MTNMLTFGPNGEANFNIVLTENQKASLPLKYNNSEGEGDFFGSDENEGIPFGEKKYSRDASGDKMDPTASDYKDCNSNQMSQKQIGVKDSLNGFKANKVTQDKDSSSSRVSKNLSRTYKRSENSTSPDKPKSSMKITGVTSNASGAAQDLPKTVSASLKRIQKQPKKPKKSPKAEPIAI